MIRKVARLCFSMSSAKKIPRPRDPSIAESFQTKLSEEQVKILIDPKGFMTEEEKQFEEANTIKTQAQPTTEETQSPEPAGGQKSMEPEYGFKPKGPEPTRFGDWQRKGRCFDF